MRACPTCQRTYSDETDFCPLDLTPLQLAVAATAAALEAGLARRFRVGRRLGTGGMGTVFLAEQIGVGNRPVALKVLLRKLLDDPEFLLRFQNEAASTGRIHHANVVTIYESGQADDGSPYIAMEYLEGETLRQALKRGRPLPLAVCVEITQQVARGLNAAHKLGIIHRDLKPDNIFLTRGDECELVVKVMDFGIAKLRESATHTLTGTVLGTPAYMSFEQASGMRSDELDARSDVYSLGVVVYEMLVGRVPFHSDTPLGYLRKHLMEAPPSFRAIAPGLPVSSEVEGVVMKALTKDREQRHPSALDFSRELARAASGTAGAKTPSAIATIKLIEPGEAPQGWGAFQTPGTAIQPGTDLYGRSETAVATPPTPLKPASPPVRSGPVARQVPAAQAPSAVSPRVATTAPGRAKHYVVGALVAGLLALVAGIGGLWYFSQSGGNQATQQVSPAQNPVSATTAAPPTKAEPLPPGVVSVTGGTFTMGRDNAADPEETPAHPVAVSSFYLDKTPVTNHTYLEFLRATQHEPTPAWKNGTYPAGQDNWPVVRVSWNDAQAYCEWKGERLPSEAEWEFAARGNDARLYPWGNQFSSALANSLLAGLGHTEPVGAHPDAASPSGVLDMSGNVWQWCADDYKPYPGRQSAFSIPADAKVIRGGSFQSDKDHVTTTARNLDHASNRSPGIGFRCAKSF